jgi:hypothetical protein
VHELIRSEKETPTGLHWYAVSSRSQLGNRQGAVSIEDKEIDQVRTVMEERIACSPYPFLQVGQRVRIRGAHLTASRASSWGATPPPSL